MRITKFPAYRQADKSQAPNKFHPTGSSPANDENAPHPAPPPRGGRVREGVSQFWNLIIEYYLGIGAWHLAIARNVKYSKWKEILSLIGR